ICAMLVLMNYLGVRRISPYLFLGALLWVTVLKSGVHATIAGVLLALTIPLRGDNATSPAHRLESDLKAPVAFAVLPLFAFANSGVYLWDMAIKDLLHPVSTGIALGLFLGKQAGVMMVAALLVIMGWGKLPQGATWKSFYGVAVITGIGFTMSLFVGSLAFKEEAGTAAAVDERIGILVGSMLSAVVGYLLLHFATRKANRSPGTN
ncbi:MAG: Na+/H+ antiporter NhaA, partial [Burkholderiales bacterium]